MAAPFPSLVIRADGFEPQGAFAEAQAEFLRPDPEVVAELGALLERHNAGVVAHFYMDPELQGVLSACSWPHIQISDSLLMADAAIGMAKAGVRNVVVLGVDFMSENVRAMLDAAGHADVAVYRVAAAPIGCSLAESAEAPAYGAYLTQASKVPRSLHVIYINTSLEVKARGHTLVPTITCTSSNVVRTVLQAFAQIPDLSLWFGPDTYMGENLETLFASLGQMDDTAVRAVHPAHDAASIRALAERFHYFKQGVCIVHHMFGASVVKVVKEAYAGVNITAHLEVPGEMFALALDAQRHGAGVVGSTSDILRFIGDKAAKAVDAPAGTRLSFILGTEAGMITSIVRKVQDTLQKSGSKLEVEIVFPVASEAIAKTGDAELAVVPGVAGGEGCSTAGGCATCPFMKMNSLDALLAVLGQLGEPPENLRRFLPKKSLETIKGRSLAELGGEPILHMRHFQRTGVLSDALVADVIGRSEARAG
jgi:quinolinate synthase